MKKGLGPAAKERNSIVKKNTANGICRSSRAKPKLAFICIGQRPTLWLFRPYRGCLSMCFSVSQSPPPATRGHRRFPPLQNPFLTFSGQKPSFPLHALFANLLLFLFANLLFFPFLQRRSVRPVHPISVSN